MTAHHRFWVDCPRCGGQYRQGEPHERKDCIAQVISDHRFYLEDADDYDKCAVEINEMLTRWFDAAVAQGGGGVSWSPIGSDVNCISSRIENGGGSGSAVVGEKP